MRTKNVSFLLLRETVNSEGVCRCIRNVKLMNFVFEHTYVLLSCMTINMFLSLKFVCYFL